VAGVLSGRHAVEVWWLVPAPQSSLEEPPRSAGREGGREWAGGWGRGCGGVPGGGGEGAWLVCRYVHTCVLHIGERARSGPASS
jgi:hypothetical protein